MKINTQTIAPSTRITIALISSILNGTTLLAIDKPIETQNTINHRIGTNSDVIYLLLVLHQVLKGNCTPNNTSNNDQHELINPSIIVNTINKWSKETAALNTTTQKDEISPVSPSLLTLYAPYNLPTTLPHLPPLFPKLPKLLSKLTSSYIITLLSKLFDDGVTGSLEKTLSPDNEDGKCKGERLMMDIGRSILRGTKLMDEGRSEDVQLSKLVSDVGSGYDISESSLKSFEVHLNNPGNGVLGVKVVRREVEDVLELIEGMGDLGVMGMEVKERFDKAEESIGVGDNKEEEVHTHTHTILQVKDEDDPMFVGKTEAQIKKIKKIRAAKKAKADKKKKDKEKKKAGGAGGNLTEVVKDVISRLIVEGEDVGLVVGSVLQAAGKRRKPKVPKGMRDYGPKQMAVRQGVFKSIRGVFDRHGAVEIDTPIMELKDTLTGKYGEDSKLIYDLADQGGEILALRYDLTVPFARFLATNAVGNIKRYHIGKVYRRDQPQMAKGRYREFYQCDFDIAGKYGRMVPDSECVAVAAEILSSVPIGNFKIKVNHRKLLDSILEIAGVPPTKFRTICSAVDKLDKETWDTVKSEMIEKGIKGETADRIGKFVTRKPGDDPMEDLRRLIEEGVFGEHKVASEALKDLEIMFGYLSSMGKLSYVSFDLSLARGLDYYTGVIYEAVCVEKGAQVGSIGGGGRYDGLAGMFSGEDIPCVGVSVGIERVFTLVEKNTQGSQTPNVDVVIASTTTTENNLRRKMEVARELWKADIKAEISAKKLKQAIQSDVLDKGVKYMVVVGDKEWEEGNVIVKIIDEKRETVVEIGRVGEAVKEEMGGGGGAEEGKGEGKKKSKGIFAWSEKDFIR